jgi:dihydrodipicolinate synthase/N-acetylneuraminate lyase
MTITRREMLVALGAAAAAPRIRLQGAGERLRGAFMILHTPFTSTGEVDWDDLTRELAFVARCGAQGAVWPQGSSSVANLTKEERLRGMELLAGARAAMPASAGRTFALVLGVQGHDEPEMLEYARRAEALAPDAVIAMPPSTGTSMEDYREYFQALARIARRPVIVQTSGGARNLAPTVELIVQLAQEYPHFGYVKEESAPVLERMRQELGQRPPMKSVFGASFGEGWLYEMRLGLDGVMTGNAMYADLMARMWEMHLAKRTEELRDAYSKFLLMRNLSEQVPGADLYVMKKRGVFKTRVTRTGPPPAGGAAPVSERALSNEEIAEIEYRFAALAPYLAAE